MTRTALPAIFSTLLLAACSGSLENDPSEFNFTQSAVTTGTGTMAGAAGATGTATTTPTAVAGAAGTATTTPTGVAGAPATTGTTTTPTGIAGAATTGTTTAGTTGAGGATAVDTTVATAGAAPVSTAPPEVQAVMALTPNAANGATVYTANSCNACHGAMGEGVTGLGQDFRAALPAKTEEQIVDIIYNGDPDNILMAPFGEGAASAPIANQDIRDVAAYLKATYGM